MIYGEEIQRVDFSKGLWLSDSLENVPDGYAANLVNMHVNPVGNLDIRTNYAWLSSSVSCPTGQILETNGSYPGAGYTLRKTAVCFDLAPGGASAYDPIWLGVARNANTPSCVYSWLYATGDMMQVTKNAGAIANVPQSVCQYRDRYYVLTGTNATAPTGSTTVLRFIFGSSSITDSTITTILSGAHQILTFRDRIFAFSITNQAIYYTDQATVGGYPETWSASNVIYLPDAGAIVYNAFVHNDRIYMFTNRGVYQLYATGSPSNWSLQPVNPNIKVYQKDSVALVNGTFVYTDTESVYLYTGGTQIIEVGQPIKYAYSAKVVDHSYPISGSATVYSGPSEYRILPYLEGFILALGYHNNTSGATDWKQTRAPKYYYFNGETWSEIQFDYNPGNYSHYELIGTAKSKAAKVVAGETLNLNDLVYVAELYSGSYYFFPKSVRHDNSVLQADREFKTGLLLKDTEVGGEMNIARFKQLVAHTKCTLTDINFTPYVDGVACTAYNPTVAAPFNGRKYKHRIPVSIERGTNFNLSVSTTFSPTSGSGGAQTAYYYPSFRIYDIGNYVNTDTTKIPDQEYK